MTPDLDTRLNAQELARQLAEKRVSVIDVSEAMEFAGGHIEGSVNVPLARLSRTQLPQGALVLVCHSGRRSAQALAQLVRRGHTSPLAADAPGSDRRWLFGAARPGPRQLGGAGLDSAQLVCGSRPGVCWHQWFLWHGPPAGPDALEPGFDLMAAGACP